LSMSRRSSEPAAAGPFAQGFAELGVVMATGV